ncbi:hypothetical protein CCR75_002751 [Bremia lactucae]|uniref:Expansin-like EG45 domain-containing protein n=1 Tax=Bremia lactucae TaxID=4779 RepID=A0A976IIZ0_BRELC|nr:hypothetical protein CCR75_002751 [Bremia lactucae]
MRSWTLLAAATAMTFDVVTASGVVSVYTINEPAFGTCRLQGISDSSDNFNYYASVPRRDYSLNSACARCITVTRDDNPAVSTTAYVLDVCDGCDSGSLGLAASSMVALNISTTDTSTIVSYQFSDCPTSFMSGNIRACLMEGASASYVPLQYYNSQKVITSVTIEEVPATRTSSSFLYSANSGSSSRTWYENVRFSVTSDDGETLSSTLSFPGTSGCAASNVQFNSASTANGVRAGNDTSSSNGAIIGGVVGGVAAVLLIVGSIILIRRRKNADKDLDGPEKDMENQYLSPKAKTKTIGVVNSTFTDDFDDNQHPASPTVDYAESFSPAASAKTRIPDVITHKALKEPSALIAPAPVVSAAVAVYSPSSSASSHRSSGVYSNHSSLEHSPSVDSMNSAPTYAFSNPMATTSPRHSNIKAALTLSAPIVPPSNTYFQQEDVDENRTSFDIDDMRESEARATLTDRSSRLQTPFVPYSAADPYTIAMTSPERNVRATSFRRPSFKQNSMRASGRDFGRDTNDSIMSEADSYSLSAPRQGNQSILSNDGVSNSLDEDKNLVRADSSESADADTMTDSARDGFTSIQQNWDPTLSQSSTGSNGGYSRESLNILGYPYSKRSGRHHNITAAVTAR